MLESLPSSSVVSMPIQERIALMSRNQSLIDILVGNNTLLMQSVLTEAALNNAINLSGLPPHITMLLQQASNPQTAMNILMMQQPKAPGLIEADNTPGRKKKFHRQIRNAIAGKTSPPREKKKSGLPTGYYDNLLYAWAKKHDGEIDLIAFRDAVKPKADRRIPGSFWETTMYCKAARLASLGFLSKMDGRHYKVLKTPPSVAAEHAVA